MRRRCGLAQRPVQVGAGQVGVEELADEGLAAADRGHHGLAAVDPLEHEALEAVLARRRRRARR